MGIQVGDLMDAQVQSMSASALGTLGTPLTPHAHPLIRQRLKSTPRRRSLPALD